MGGRETYGPDATDDELVAAAGLGREKAFEALYYRYRDWVLRQAMRTCRNQDDALDAMQEVFAYFFGKFPGFRLRSKMTTFLYPVVRNVSISLLRKRGRTVPLDEGIPEPEAPPNDHTSEFKEGVGALLERLPFRQREVLLLRFVDEMSLLEIAEALEVPLGTVKSRLHNALERLRAGRREKF